MTPPDVDMGSVGRLLIIKLSAFGDIIHALPVASAIKATFPHVEISWVVEEQYEPLLTGNAAVTNVLTLPKVDGKLLRSVAFHKNYWNRLWKFRKPGFDLSIDLQGLTKSAVVAVGSGARRRIAYHWVREAASLLEYPIPQQPNSVHIVDQYLDVARFLGAKAEKPEFSFHIPEQDEAAVTAMLAEQGIPPGVPFVSINPASAVAMKQWSAAKYGALVNMLDEWVGLKSVLVTADCAVADQVTSATSVSFANLAGKTSLKQLGAVLKRGVAHVCGDTGSGHLAAALGTPVVALIGPTDADRICPYGQRDNVIRHLDRCGASCGWHRCQYQSPLCLEAITVGEVAAQVEQVITGKKNLAAVVSDLAICGRNP